MVLRTLVDFDKLNETTSELLEETLEDFARKLKQGTNRSSRSNARDDKVRQYERQNQKPDMCQPQPSDTSMPDAPQHKIHFEDDCRSFSRTSELADWVGF